MNLPTYYDTGTVSVGAGGSTVTGVGSLWGTGGVDDNIMIGDLFSVPSQPMVPAVVISGVNADGELELMWPWPGTAVTAQPYIIRYVGIIERSTRANRIALERIGEISAWYDIIVETDAERFALETTGSPLRANYRVLVREDGVIWAKETSTYGDWIGPVEFRGPVGPAGVINWRGAYSSGTVYAVNDGVRYNGSSFYKLIASAAGNAPASAFPPVDNTHWAVIAAKGQDGTGTGDFVGPASSVNNRLVAFSGTTGKLGADSGINTADVMLKAPGSVLQSVASYFSSRAVATTGIPFDNTPPQSTEGDPLLTAAITPTSTTNKLRVRVALFGTCAGLANFIGALFVGTGSIGTSAVATSISTTPGADYFQSTFFEYEYTPGTLSAQAMSVRVGPAGGGSYFINGTTAGDLFGGGKFRCSITVEEIQA